MHSPFTTPAAHGGRSRTVGQTAIVPFRVPFSLPLFFSKSRLWCWVCRLLSRFRRTMWPASLLALLACIPNASSNAIAQFEPAEELGGLEDLRKQLKSSDSDARVLAARRIGKYLPSSQSVCKDLVASLQDKYEAVREVVKELLVKNGSPSIPFLLDGCQASSELQKSECISVLGSIRRTAPPDPRVDKAILDGLRDSSRIVKQTSVAAVSHQPRITTAIPLLVDFVNNDPELRPSAIISLGRFGHEAGAAQPVLMAIVSNRKKSIEERVMAQKAIVQVVESDEKVGLLMCEIMLDRKEDIRVRYTAASVLGANPSLGQPAINALARVVKDMQNGEEPFDSSLCDSCLNSLSVLTPPAHLLPFLETVIKDKRHTGYGRIRAIVAIGHAGVAAKECGSFLASLVKATDIRESSAALDSLCRVLPPRLAREELERIKESLQGNRSQNGRTLKMSIEERLRVLDR